jgi:hypothetical protein
LEEVSLRGGSAQAEFSNPLVHNLLDVLGLLDDLGFLDDALDDGLDLLVLLDGRTTNWTDAQQPPEHASI